MRKSRILKYAVSFAGVYTLALLAGGQTSSPGAIPSPPPGYAIAGVAVIDVERAAVRADQTVLVEGERILRIGSRAEIDIPKGFQTIDGRGLHLIPGLIDAHVHYYDPPVFGRAMLANGVVMVREMGQPNDTMLPLRQALNEGALLGPEMVATGWILDGDPPFIPEASHGVKTPEEGRAEVRRQAAAGVDQIKVYSKLEKDVFAAICDEARRVGLKPVGHVPEAVYLEDAVAAGLRSIEHVHGFDKVVGRLLGEPIKLKSGGMGVNFDYWPRLSEVDPGRLAEVLGRIRAAGVVVCPTVIVFKSQAGLGDVTTRTYPGHEFISPLIQGIWNSLWNPANRAEMETLWPPIAAFVGALHKAGIPLMIGTDVTMPGVIPGFAVHEEMAVWQEAGIPPADILRGATIVPARFLNRDQRLGTIAAGKIASLALVRGNPLEDIRNAEKIEGVFLRGRFFNRADLDQFLKEAQDLARQ